ncbi:MAG: hypothetical protein A4S17_02470 [Proteobacteria bacterium HN_bin10]|nr:MAG: hypothetical protein A4S17_02470 [Proteobacteria bacterium HN_bin10]
MILAVFVHFVVAGATDGYERCVIIASQNARTIVSVVNLGGRATATLALVVGSLQYAPLLSTPSIVAAEVVVVPTYVFDFWDQESIWIQRRERRAPIVLCKEEVHLIR